MEASGIIKFEPGKKSNGSPSDFPELVLYRPAAIGTVSKVDDEGRVEKLWKRNFSQRADLRFCLMLSLFPGANK
jgi:hypothetical protein